jgi:hypothetical protein
MSTHIKPAIETLQHLDGTKLLDKLGIAINDATNAVTVLGKKATITVTIQVGLLTQKGLSEPAISITGEVDTKLPKPDPEATIFFVDEESNPTLTATRQRQMDIRIAADNTQGDAAHG